MSELVYLGLGSNIGDRETYLFSAITALDVRQDININRTEEALALNPDIIATGCPFCNTMMTDGVKSVKEGDAEVKDIAELIAENI